MILVGFGIFHLDDDLQNIFLIDTSKHLILFRQDAIFTFSRVLCLTRLTYQLGRARLMLPGVLVFSSNVHEGSV